jgi:hypothetical protein
MVGVDEYGVCRICSAGRRLVPLMMRIGLISVGTALRHTSVSLTEPLPRLGVAARLPPHQRLLGLFTNVDLIAGFSRSWLFSQGGGCAWRLPLGLQLLG